MAGSCPFFVTAVKSLKVVETLSAQGGEIAASSSETFARFLRGEHACWSNTIRTARITLTQLSFVGRCPRRNAALERAPHRRKCWASTSHA
jgi:hypothetical protein